MTCAGVEGLKFCIQQFIHPYQALLLDRSQDSTLNKAADVLQHCSVSVHWEVRDSAMERAATLTVPQHVSFLISPTLGDQVIVVYL